ncbi:phosphotransferase [Phytomonospora sp. NPDC050363]|uniref:phosphotransferase n=1 Tax=Phytomonospora sp. NPDC050363 TaxID=3155642 RepID=UPI0033D37717
MSNDTATARRAQYVNEVLPILYPQPWQRGGDPAEPGAVRMIAVPNIRHPRLLVPANSPKVAAAALARYARPPSRLARLKRDAAVLALRTGMSRLLLRDRITVTSPDPEADSLAGFLSGVLDTSLHISVHIGPARANRKPVVQLLTEYGQTVAFAKIGVNALTQRLVADETEALQRLAKSELSTVTVPGIRHAGLWREHMVLVQQALPIWNDRVAVTPGRLAEAMREIATVEGIHNRRLEESDYAATLRERLDALDDTADARELRAAAVELLDAAAAERLSFGAWHGDWTPWNMAMLAETVLVWDWERFCLDAPLGFDALHYRLQHDIVIARRDPAAAVDHCVNKAESLLAPFFPAHPAPAPPRLARLTALLYLIDLATRYLTDRQAEAGARLGALGTWLLPVLVRRVSAFATSVVADGGSTSPEGN